MTPFRTRVAVWHRLAKEGGWFLGHGADRFGLASKARSTVPTAFGLASKARSTWAAQSGCGELYSG